LEGLLLEGEHGLVALWTSSLAIGTVTERFELVESRGLDWVGGGVYVERRELGAVAVEGFVVEFGELL
jgi:hypothetical protein